MAFVVLNSKGKRVGHGVPGRVLPLVWTAAEVKRLARKRVCYTVGNTKTGRDRKVGLLCSKRKRRRRR